MTTAPQPFLGVENSLTGRLWRSRLEDERLALAVSQQLGLPEVLGRVLAARGIPPEEGAAYLAPTLRDQLPDPSRLRDMDRAAARLTDAVMTGEIVGIFGDYDVDGATSSALLARFLRAVGGQVRLYIPDRLTEGYGPNTTALLALREEGLRVVVTVDCGTLAFEPLEAAHAAGLDVIVVDHHLAEPGLPPALAVINPNRLDESGTCGQLAAVGVAYLLVIAVNRALRAAGWYGDRAEPNLLQWLDIVALGTVCDVVPLTGLNRPLVLSGLKVMAGRTNPGLAALADVAGLDSAPGVYHAGFVLGPRVNAGGRVGRADLGARLLATDDAAEAAALAGELDVLNRERRTIEAMVEEEAMSLAEQTDDGGPLVFVAGRGWHPGVIGIVASRLKGRFNRPAFIVALEDGVGKGSGRSVPGADLGAAVTAARQAGLLINGGGHPMAAGLTVAEDKLAPLGEFLKERLSRSLGDRPKRRSLGVDGALGVGGASFELVELLDQAGPYGAGNPEPRFVVTGAHIVRSDIVGGDHVRCVLAGGEGGRLKGIAFRCRETALGEALLNQRGAKLYFAGHLRADHWQGRDDVQLEIEDVASAN